MPRLTFLTEHEQREFDSPPLLSVEARAVCFVMSNDLSKKIHRLHTPDNKIGFLLQYAYFKACKRFFIISRFRQEDIEFASKILGIPLTEVRASQKGMLKLFFELLVEQQLPNFPAIHCLQSML